MVLPKIPRSIVKQLDNLIRGFIWNNKKSKIAYNILQNPKEAGGLNLVNLEKKDIALKATWPQILYKESEYSKMVYSMMKCSTLQDDIWRCHLNQQDVKCLKITNQFWQDVLTSWSHYNYYYQNRYENQLIWYNSDIKV